MARLMLPSVQTVPSGQLSFPSTTTLSTVLPLTMVTGRSSGFSIALVAPGVSMPWSLTFRTGCCVLSSTKGYPLSATLTTRLVSPNWGSVGLGPPHLLGSVGRLHAGWRRGRLACVLAQGTADLADDRWWPGNAAATEVLERGWIATSAWSTLRQAAGDWFGVFGA